MKGLAAALWIPIREAFLTLGARPGRLLLTASGTVLGTGALVATAGLTSTIEAQVSDRFDRYAATEVVVTPVRESAEADGDEPLDELPNDASTRGSCESMGPSRRGCSGKWIAKASA